MEVLQYIFVKRLVNKTSNNCLKNNWVQITKWTSTRQFIWYHRTVKTEWFSDCLPPRLYLNVYIKTHIDRYLKKRRQNGKNEVPDSKKSRRSTVTAFDFQTYCLFWGKLYQEKDPKHPDRWQNYYIVRSVYTAGWIPFKDFILSICSLGNDELSRDVWFRVRPTI